LGLLTSKDKPVNFFGRNINWMTPKVISKIVFKYLKTGIFDLTLLDKRDRFYAINNERSIKHILINKIDFLIEKIKLIDQSKNRISILDQMDFTSDQLQSFYNYCSLDDDGPKKSLELTKPITER
jgi:hypothetical protein